MMATVDVKPAVSRAEDRMAVVDDGNMLAKPSPLHSPSKERRSSYEVAAAAGQSFASHDGAWPGMGFSLDHGGVPGSEAGMHPFFNVPTPSTIPPSASIPSASFSPSAAWPSTDNSGECTPTAGFDGMVDFQSHRASTFGQQQQPQSATSTGFETAQMQNGSHPMSAGFPPASSSSAKDGWFGSSSEGLDFQPVSHQTPLGQAFATSTSILRRDGIRKKNARFEIPAERNLRTIDHLINQSTDEHEIKELKQQKRLLRNRQAALDSRQRKKQHTERLEEEKKHYTTIIGELEEALNDTKMQEADYLRQKEAWAAQQQQYQAYIEQLVMEKDELLRRHTIEGGELRKKNAILMEQVQRLESTTMSTAPSSAGFSTEFSDFDQLTMHSWDDFSLSHDFSLEADTRTEVPMPNQQKKTFQKQAPAEDKNVTSGFLLMLLLCGAWVVSHQSKSSTELLPSVPEEMKTASAAVLDNLYKDSGIQLQTGAGHTPRPSTGLDGFEMASLSQTSLESLHHRLVTPSERQMQEQAFSLTPRQYNDITSGVSHYSPSSSNYPSVQSVGNALSADPSSFERASPVEAYTRSLLKGRVSSQVLKDFARMVAATQPSGATQTWKVEPVD